MTTSFTTGSATNSGDAAMRRRRAPPPRAVEPTKPLTHQGSRIAGDSTDCGGVRSPLPVDPTKPSSRSPTLRGPARGAAPADEQQRREGRLVVQRARPAAHPLQHLDQRLARLLRGDLRRGDGGSARGESARFTAAADSSAAPHTGSGVRRGNRLSGRRLGNDETVWAATSGTAAGALIHRAFG
jgi:hypothetical protein